MSRLDDMLERYGEVCNKGVATKILSCSLSGLNLMIRDGRIRSACGGKKVDVRSIAEYIEDPAPIEEAARVERIKRRYGSGWAV